MTPRFPRKSLTAQWQQSRHVLAFLAAYGGLLVVFQLLYYQVIVPSEAFVAYMEWSGRVAAVLLRVAGEEVVAAGSELRSSFTMSIRQGCDGLQAMAILVIAIAVFPGTILRKVWGAATGVAILLILNTLRIASLFWLGSNRPEWFQAFHVHIWPSLLVFVALGFWAVWVVRATPPRVAAT